MILEKTSRPKIVILLCRFRHLLVQWSAISAIILIGCNPTQENEPVKNIVPFRTGVAKMIGGGSTNNAVYENPSNINIYEAANVLGYGAARGNLNHHEYWQDGKPVTKKFDRFIGWYKHGVKPLLLFNHYPDAANPVGGYDKWYAIGNAFAERFRPNSEFLLSKGIKDWGITDFMVFNEPEWHIIRHPGTMSPEEYKMALKGLADGVHAVDPALRVSPGGYTFPIWDNVLKDPPNTDALKLVEAIAPLYNDGTLHAFYLHPYVRKNDFRKKRSAQNIFDHTKKAFGIKKDIHFAVLEYCYAGSYVVNGQKDNNIGIDKNANEAEFYGEASEQEKALGQMAAFWDNITVTGNKGQPITDYVLAWEPLSTYLNNLNWGLAKSKAPYEGRIAANIIQLNTYLTNGMSFTAIDRDREVFTLNGDGNQLVVWQNWDGWSSICGNSFILNDISTETQRLDVFDALSWKSGPGFSGIPQPVQQHTINEERTFIVENLQKGHTYLFMLWGNEKKRIPPRVSIKNTIDNQGYVQINGNVQSSESNIKLSRIYNGAHLITEIPAGGKLHYTWENPAPGLNELRITAIDENGLLNTAQETIEIPHKNDKLIPALHDTYIRGHHKRYSQKNFNNMKVLEAKTGGQKAIRHPYLLFDLNSAPESFETCRLMIKINENSDFMTNKCLLFAIEDDSWKETDLTWDNAPAKGDLLGTESVPASGEWIAFDVTSFIKNQIQKDKRASFRLEKPGRTYVSFFSREAHPLNVPILSFE